MNKSELVEAIAKETGVSKKDTEATLKAFVNVVSDTLQKKEKVQLIGFGSFETVDRAARTGVNPQSGEKIKIKAFYVGKIQGRRTAQRKGEYKAESR